MTSIRTARRTGLRGAARRLGQQLSQQPSQQPSQRPLRRTAPFQSSRPSPTSASSASSASSGLSVEQMSAERDAALLGNSAGHTGLVALLYAEAAETALLSSEEERALLSRAQAGDLAARDHLIRANVRLVGRVAQWYLSHSRAGSKDAQGIGRDDLVQDGILGLMRAIDRFDLSTNNRFSTYAVQWIRQAISRALDDRGLTVRLPVYLRTLIRRVERARLALLDEHNGVAPSAEALAALLDLRVGQVEEALALSVYTHDPLSLDRDVSRPSDDPFTFADLLADPAAEETLEAIETNVDHALAEHAPDSVTQIMARLKRRRRMRIHTVGALRDVAREMEIIERRVLRGETFEEIARALGLTRQRIQQLEKKGVEAIRAERARVRREMTRAQVRRTGQPQPLRQQDRPQQQQQQQKGGAA
ncbi:MAG TPA: sigma-70 family RNA polymerase sigma factor [Ktedonobacterales bacterium]|nr:sigma-70 family RNA polymerase sigma factor [Ktedonobacterales bacterium]